MKITVVGAGAVGGLVGGWLAGRLPAGQVQVSALARGATLQALRERGLQIDAQAPVRIHASDDPAALGVQDLVVVAVKGPALAAVAPAVRALCGPHTDVLVAMNGVPWWFFDRLPYGGGKLRLESLDPGGALARAMPTERLVGCVIHLAASQLEPGLISHNQGNRLILGEPGGRNTVRTQRLAEALGRAGFECAASGHIEKDFWVKLLGNVSFNPVSALTLATADRLIGDDQVKAYMVAIMREVMAIGRAVGVDADIDPEARIDMARAFGAFKTSMLQDLEAGKALEIDGLLAGTLEIARKAGVPAPFTESLYGLIRLRAETTRQYRAPLA